MMKFVFTTALLMACATALFAQGAPFGGSAQVRLASTSTAAIPGNGITVDVVADLTGVTGTCGTAVPAVLGGYTIPLNFDNTQLQFVSSSACDSPQYTTAPTTTAAATANSTGQVSITASQTSQTAPTGSVCVARLTFQVIGGNGTTITPQNSATLSSAFQNCGGGGSAGPAAIPFTTLPLTLAPASSVPTLSQYALIGLALTLAFVALFSRSLR